MEAYRTYLTINDPWQVVLRNVPFRPGQCVEVLLLTHVDDVTAEQEMRALFEETQSLPQVKTLSDEEIAAEVMAHREGR